MTVYSPSAAARGSVDGFDLLSFAFFLFVLAVILILFNFLRQNNRALKWYRMFHPKKTRKQNTLIPSYAVAHAVSDESDEEKTTELIPMGQPLSEEEIQYAIHN
tara:strand:- start:200 stop:511 length:312 start_codon:yes stop_codon:yes gene_type:complete